LVALGGLRSKLFSTPFHLPEQEGCHKKYNGPPMSIDSITVADTKNPT
jgi:hypothetical protein